MDIRGIRKQIDELDDDSARQGLSNHKSQLSDNAYGRKKRELLMNLGAKLHEYGIKHNVA
jgi:hypothetical protein